MARWSSRPTTTSRRPAGRSRTSPRSPGRPGCRSSSTTCPAAPPPTPCPRPWRRSRTSRVVAVKRPPGPGPGQARSGPHPLHPASRETTSPAPCPCSRSSASGDLGRREAAPAEMRRAVRPRARRHREQAQAVHQRLSAAFKALFLRVNPGPVKLPAVGDGPDREQAAPAAGPGRGRRPRGRSPRCPRPHPASAARRR